MLPANTFRNVEDFGVGLARPEDGGQLLLSILSNSSINGRFLFLSPDKWALRGYIDLDVDDYHDDLLQEIQADQLKGPSVSKGLFLEGK